MLKDNPIVRDNRLLVQSRCLASQHHRTVIRDSSRSPRKCRYPSFAYLLFKPAWSYKSHWKFLTEYGLAKRAYLGKTSHERSENSAADNLEISEFALRTVSGHSMFYSGIKCLTALGQLLSWSLNQDKKQSKDIVFGRDFPGGPDSGIYLTPTLACPGQNFMQGAFLLGHMRRGSYSSKSVFLPSMT